MMPWNHELQHKTETSSDREYIVNWTRPETGAQVAMSTRFPNAPEYSDLLRTICHQAIEMLPNTGLNELYTSLGEMIEFYSEENSIYYGKTLLSVTTLPARKGSTYERTPFQIDED